MVTTTRRVTVEEFERGPYHDQWELVDGVPIKMSPVGGRSSRVASRISRALSNFVLPRHLGEMYAADCGYVLFPDRATVRAPDASFVRAGRLTEQAEVGFLRLVPDLAVEVLSPTDERAEVAAKIADYLAAGVPVVWVVDPATRTTTIYRPAQEPAVFGADEPLDAAPALPDFRMTLAEMLA